MGQGSAEYLDYLKVFSNETIKEPTIAYPFLININCNANLNISFF